ncbi:T9SS type A sorting domain-containing protein [Flagellimonas sp. S174]|uniref:T9SS type A sorting domain-containing protein n=1 Tax=Flagellimonas sp. S174 TaxID=3410790 RepID=UPI003BF516EA
MKRKLLLCSLCLLLGSVTWAQNQYAIQFSYDSAGNQTLRDRVCINCGTSKEALDSIPTKDIAIQEDLLEDLSGVEGPEDISNIAAYPNPVTDLLTLEWQDNERQVTKIILFSGIGRQLYEKTISSRQGNTQLDFGIYPTGHYILSVYYTDSTRKTFHILKK